MGKLIFMCALLFVLAGCRSVQYVPVKSTGHDSINVNHIQRDSIYRHDSVFVYQWTKGDTVFSEKVVSKYVYNDKTGHDTVFIVRTDSVDRPVTVMTEKPLSLKQKVLIKLGYVGLAAVLLFLGLAAYAFLRKGE